MVVNCHWIGLFLRFVLPPFLSRQPLADTLPPGEGTSFPASDIVFDTLSKEYL